MIQIVMKPTPGEGVVDRETLYTVLFNGEDVGLRVRGLRASHAEAKMMAVFRAQLRGKTVSYDLEAYERSLNNDTDAGTHEELRKAAEPAKVPAPHEGVGEGGAVASDGA